MERLYQRITDSAEQIGHIKNRQARRDLLKMLRTVDSALTQLDMESVECRRLGRVTARYQELETTANELVSNLEQHLTLARLLYT